MAGAQANATLTIHLDGAGNAAEAIARAQDALIGLEGRAKKVKPATADMTKAGEDGLKNLREKSGDVESALKGISDFAGKGKEQLSVLGDAFGGVEAVMRLLPGQAGLIATGIAGAALGAKLLYDHLQQSEAKLRLLASADAKKLGDSLGFAADETVRVSKAMAGLEGATGPAQAQIVEVARAAKQMGADSAQQAEAVEKFLAAWKEGPDAVKKVQQEIGTLSIQMESLVSVSRSLGLDPTALGIDKTKTALELLIEGEKEIARQRAAVQALNQNIAEQQAIINTGTLRQMVAAQDAIKPLKEQKKELEEQLDLNERQAKFRAVKIEGEQAFANATKATAQIQAEADANATARGATREALAIRIVAIQRQQEVLTAAIAKQQDLVAKGSGKEAQERLAALQLQMKILENQAVSIAAQDVADRKAKAREAAAASAANRQAIRDANIAAMRAKADLDGVQSYEERLALIDAEQRAATTSVNESVKNAKVRAAKIAQIEAEAATKRAALDRDFRAQYDKATEDGAKATADSMVKTVERQRAADDAMAASAKALASVQADAARQSGDEAQAADIERLAAHADYANQMKAIDTDLAASLQQVVAGSTDAQALQTTAEQKRIQAKLALDEVERKIDQGKRERDLQARAAAADVLSQVADTYQALGQLGNVYAGAFGQSLNAAVSGFKSLDAAMSKSKVNAADVSQAVTQMANGIASSWIDAEAQRTAKQLDAEEQRALSTATTEEQRAAVTAEFEAKKAKAVQDAEREKAAILALMEIANAAASYPNIPAMVAHGAAAALYGAVAGGIVGGTSSAASPSMPSGGGFAAKQATGGGQGGQQGGGATVYNFFGVYGTKQQLGKTMAEANRAMASSGYRGKGV